MNCPHDVSAQAALLWPLLTLFIAVVLISGVVASTERHKARVARERARRVEVQLQAWKEQHP